MKKPTKKQLEQEVQELRAVLERKVELTLSRAKEEIWEEERHFFLNDGVRRTIKMLLDLHAIDIKFLSLFKTWLKEGGFNVLYVDGKQVCPIPARDV